MHSDPDAGSSAGTPRRPAFPTVAAVLLIAWLLCVPLVYLLTARAAPNPDPFVYAELSREVLAGKRLYAQEWENKAPLAIMAYALPQLVVPRSYGAICCFLGIVLSVQSLCYWRAWRSCWPAVLCCVSLTTLLPLTFYDFMWPSTEHFANLPATASLLLGYAIFRAGKFTLLQCAALGALACVTFHIRQNVLLASLLPLAAIVAAAQPRRRKIIGLGVFVGAGLLAWGIILAWVWHIGDVPLYFYAVFQSPVVFVREASGRFLFFSKFVKYPSTALPLVAALAPVLVLCKTRDRWPVLITLASGLVCCLLPVRNFAHYWLNFMPFVTLVAAMAVSHFDATRRRWTALAACVLTAYLMVLAGVRLIGYAGATKVQSYERIAAATDAVAPAGATLMVCGDLTSGAIQFFSQLRPPHGYFMPGSLDPPYAQTLPGGLGAILQEHLDQPPGVLVVSQKALQWLRGESGTWQPFYPQQLRLVGALMTKYTYRAAVERDGYVVEIRDDHGS